MKYLKRFDEKLSFKSLYGNKYTQDDIENLFNISMDEIEDIVSDVLDENSHLSCNVYLWSKDRFVIGFEVEPIGSIGIIFTHGDDALEWLFERSLVTQYVNDINHRLNAYGLKISSISNEEDPNYKKTFAVNLFISRMDKSLLESNYTNPNEENLLQKYFDITSEDIQDWCQDFLDEFTELDFEISVVNRSLFMINFFEVDNESHRIRSNITKEKYPFPDDILQFLKDRLKDYSCYIVPEPGSKESGMSGDVYYAINKQYISLRVVKKY
jgi:hypothetical protein